MNSIPFDRQEPALATAQNFGQVAVSRPVSLAESTGLWGRASTWGLMLLLFFFALDGVSPFVNAPVATRAVATNSAGGVVAERLTKLLIFVACMAFVIPWYQSVRRLSMQTRLITAFPILALLLCPVSQLASRTISSGFLLLGSVLLLYYIMARYTLDQVLELLLVLGTASMATSILFALALPQYGLDLMGGHASAWKGIFSAKNYLGNIALFFLTVAVSYRGRTPMLRSLRVSQILFCLVAIAFSRAATAYMLTALYVAYCVVIKTLQRFGKKDYFFLCLLMLMVFCAAAGAIAAWPDLLLSLLGKDATFTGRTEIWVAAIDSIAKRPLLGYGYQAFWLGLEGESYRVILTVSWMLAQAQNGFIDVTLEMGLAGLAIVLLIFGFAFRDAAACLLRSRDDAQLRSVEWYLAVVLLSLLCNLSESFLFDAKHLGSLMFLLACIGLKREWMRLRASNELAPCLFPR